MIDGGKLSGNPGISKGFVSMLPVEAKMKKRSFVIVFPASFLQPFVDGAGCHPFARETFGSRHGRSHPEGLRSGAPAGRG